MRKIIVFENLSADGFLAGPKGELDWSLPSPEAEDNARQGRDQVAAFLFGRVTYQMMAAFWPTPAGKAASPVFAQALNSLPKFVFSRTLKSADWAGTTVLPELTQEAALELKQGGDGNLMIFGSATLVRALAALGLVDEYVFLFNPVVLGQGLRLFGPMEKYLRLERLEATPFKNGVVMLRYRPLP